MAVSVPLWAYGIADDKSVPLWAAAVILAVGFIGLCFGLHRHIMELPVRHALLCRYVSMTATYVWPGVLGALICIHFGFSALPFYVLIGITVGAIIVTDRFDI